MVNIVFFLNVMLELRMFCLLGVRIVFFSILVYYKSIHGKRNGQVLVSALFGLSPGKINLNILRTGKSGQGPGKSAKKHI